MITTTSNIISQNLTRLVIHEEIIMSVDNAFEDFTGFYKEDVYKKSVSTVFNELLKMRVDVNGFKFGQLNGPYLMFTKNYEVKEIDIYVETRCELDVIGYSFIERPNSRLDEKFIFLEQQFIDNVIGMAIYSVPDLILLKANQKYLNYFKAPFNKRENSIGLPICEIISSSMESLFEPIWKTFQKSQKSQYLKEQIFESTDRGSTYWDITITPVTEKGELKYICNNNVDVTDRVMAKQRLAEQTEIIRQQKEQLESIIGNMSDGLFTVDENEQIILLNESAERFFYVPKNHQLNWEVLKYTKYYDTDGKEVLITDFLSKRFLTGENIKSFRLTVERPDGIKHFDVSGTPIFDMNEHLKSAVICTRDVTEYVENGKLIREQKENLLKSEMEKNQILKKIILMKDEFLSTISHEFKTPLNVINSAIQAMELLCKDELSLRAKRYIKSIRQNAFRQLRLVNNLLDITRVQAGKMKLNKKNIDIVFISKSIVDSVSLYAQQKRIKLTFSSTVAEKMIGIDEEKYERILLNLLSNAIRFTPEEKKVTVKLSSEKDFVRIEVKDNGVGIPEDKHKEIFERFGQADSSLTRQAEGTGIGLSLVKQLVNTLGGQISVKSKVGKGSNFILLLPDQKVLESTAENILVNLADNRLVQSIAIEFSDIYLS